MTVEFHSLETRVEIVVGIHFVEILIDTLETMIIGTYMIVDMLPQRQHMHKIAITVACRHCKNKHCMGVLVLVSSV